MKIVSRDHAFIYYIRDRPDGKAEGIRFDNSGAMGFVAFGRAIDVTPRSIVVRDTVPISPPVDTFDQMPPILREVLTGLPEHQAEIRSLLSGKIGFVSALVC